MYYVILELKTDDREEAVEIALELLDREDEVAEVTLSEAVPGWWKS